MTDKIVISPAKETDLLSIKSLLQELMEAMENKEGFDIEQSMKNCQNLLNDPGCHILIARDNNKVYGLVNFTARKTLMHPARCGLIDELVVTNIARGKGIGKQLVLAAIEKCRWLGCCEVEVSAEKSNLKARRFYKSCGFEESVFLEMDLD